MKRVVKWIRKKMRRALMSDFERYIAGARNLHEVEERMRNFHRRHRDHPHV